MKFKFNEQPTGEQEHYEVLQPGFYTFHILDTYTENKEGKKYITGEGVEFIRVVCVEKESGLRLSHFVFLDSGQSKKVYYFLTAIGLEPKAEEVEIVPEDWVGRLFRGKVDINKEDKNVIRACYPIPGKQPETKEPKPEPESESRGVDLFDEDVPF